MNKYKQYNRGNICNNDNTCNYGNMHVCNHDNNNKMCNQDNTSNYDNRINNDILNHKL
jgi:hypothetical protein